MSVQLSCSFPLTRPRKASSEPPAPREDPFLLHTQRGAFHLPSSGGTQRCPGTVWGHGARFSLNRMEGSRCA